MSGRPYGASESEQKREFAEFLAFQTDRIGNLKEPTRAPGSTVYTIQSIEISCPECGCGIKLPGLLSPPNPPMP